MSHRSRVAHFVIDVDDLDHGVAFWSATLDAKEEPLSEISRQVYRRLRVPDSEIRILLQRTADPKTHKERMHLDLETDDVEAEVRRLEALGATRYDHRKNVATTSGCSAIPGTTSSASFNRRRISPGRTSSHPSGTPTV